MKKEVIILHETGKPEHSRALTYLLNKNNIKYRFCEFHILKNILRSIKNKDLKKFIKQFKNLFTLVELFFSKQKITILGIAPYNFRLPILLRVLKSHKIFLHTSRTRWGPKDPYPHKLFYSKKLVSKWNNFIVKDCCKVFLTTELAQDSIIKHKNINKSNTQVVYHSFDPDVFYSEKRFFNRIDINFLFVGRLTEAKGVKLLLSFFQYYLKNHKLTIVGDGPLRNTVKEFAKKNPNCKYFSYTKDKFELANIYRRSDFLLVPSIRQKVWEELFGMVSIEAMACGAVPIATDHPGPKEIISNRKNGFIFSEDDYFEGLLNMIKKINQNSFLEISDSAVQRSSDFSLQNISKRWKEILD